MADCLLDKTIPKSYNTGILFVFWRFCKKGDPFMIVNVPVGGENFKKSEIMGVTM